MTRTLGPRLQTEPATAPGTEVSPLALRGVLVPLDGSSWRSRPCLLPALSGGRPARQRVALG
jgi:hypothetical protein